MIRIERIQKKKGRGISSDSLDIETYRCRDIPVPSLKCKGGRSSREDAAFQKSFYESHMWPPSLSSLALYSWHRVHHPPPPLPASSSTAKRPTNPRRPSTVRRGTKQPPPSNRRRNLSSYSLGSDRSTYNVTNFQLLRGLLRTRI